MSCARSLLTAHEVGSMSCWKIKIICRIFWYNVHLLLVFLTAVILYFYFDFSNPKFFYYIITIEFRIIN